MTESNLIKRLKTGDQRAFQYLVENYQDRIANTCYGFLQNHQDMEDVTQEVFIEVHRSIDRFRGDSKLSTWLYRIAVTRSLDLLRKRKRKNWLQLFNSVIGAEQIKQIQDKSPTPYDYVENEERAKILQDKVASLSTNQRIAFTLSQYEGLSYKEIARVMDISLSSVESLLFRARQNLKKKLEAYYRQ